jgi:hypothetical protein
MVKPKVLPAPLGRAVITMPLLSQLTAAFQVAMIRCGLRTVTVTVQAFVPLTVTWPLNRSFHFWPSA